MWALLFVGIFGPGALAGTLAIAFRSIGFVGKLVGEALEEAQPGPIEALTAAGAPWRSVLLFGYWPQVKPAFWSIALFRWDINVRESAVLGLVGAGGIGMALDAALNLFQWEKVALILIAILTVVDRRRNRRHADPEARALIQSMRARAAGSCKPRPHGEGCRRLVESRPMATIAVFNQKGGVGKTTTALNLLAAIAQRGYRPSGIDLDPQGHLSGIFGVKATLADESVYSFFSRQRPLPEIACISKSGVVMVPSHLELAKLDAQLGKSINVLRGCARHCRRPTRCRGPWSSTAARCSTCCR